MPLALKNVCRGSAVSFPLARKCKCPLYQLPGNMQGFLAVPTSCTALLFDSTALCFCLLQFPLTSYFYYPLQHNPSWKTLQHFYFFYFSFLQMPQYESKRHMQRTETTLNEMKGIRKSLVNFMAVLF